MPSEAELADPAVYAANVRELIAGKLGLQDCDLAVEDARRFYAACEEGGKGEQQGGRGSEAPAGLDDRKKSR